MAFNSNGPSADQIQQLLAAHRARAATGIYSPVEATRYAAQQARPGYADQRAAMVADAQARQQAMTGVSQGLSNQRAISQLPQQWSSNVEPRPGQPVGIMSDPSTWASWQHLNPAEQQQLVTSMGNRGPMGAQPQQTPIPSYLRTSNPAYGMNAMQTRQAAGQGGMPGFSGMGGAMGRGNTMPGNPFRMARRYG